MSNTLNWKVQLFKLNYDEQEYNAVLDTLKSGWITMGPKTIEFENAYERELGENTRCIAVSSGTAALHIAMLACGIKPGDEVIVPSLTFIADINVVTICGGIPVLADIKSYDDWSMDPADIESKITNKTKAVMVVHYAGFACDMDTIVAICKKHNLKLIEDCAHANGGTYKGKKLGTFGDISAWSFFSNKNLSVGEGGMVAVNNLNLYEKCKYLRSHGMTVASFDRIKGRASSYDVVEAGLNYRIDELRAALGLVQLAKLPQANKARANLVKHYIERLDNNEFISIPFKNFNNGTPTFHIMPILLSDKIDRAKLIELMQKDGIQTSIHYPAIQSFKAYKDIVSPTPKSQYVSQLELTLPLYPTMTVDEVDIVCDSIEKNLTLAQK
jgi:dTDP-4-amino-4,6-dideoxygalactose transaminase